MRKSVVLLLCFLISNSVMGCTTNDGKLASYEAMDTDLTTAAYPTTGRYISEITFPQEIEIDDLKIKVKSLVLKQEKTDHGYNGYGMFELDFSDFSEDDYYWFNEDYIIYVSGKIGTDESGNERIEYLGSTDLEYGTKRAFFYIRETRMAITESNMDLKLEISNTDDVMKTRYINFVGRCSECKIVPIYRNDIENDLDKVIGEWKELHKN